MINKNEEYVLEVKGMTHEGQGVGRIDNFTVFVDGALSGEKVRIKIIKVNKSYAIGKLIEIIVKSRDRIEPFCGSFKRCGGCNLQYMDYQAQLRFKADVVRESLKRIGRLEGVTVHDTIGMENCKNYRNKAQYPVGNVKGELAMGFYAKRTHDIVESDECGIQSVVSDKIREIVKDFFIENEISAYDEATGEGLVRNVMIRTGFRTGEIMVVIVVNGRGMPKGDVLARKLTSVVPEVSSIVVNINVRNTNVVMGDKNVVIYGKDHIVDYIGGLKFKISPNSFLQVNPVQTEVLYEKVSEYAGLTGNEVVFDLYCGIGTIGLYLSDKAKRIYGVELLDVAVRDAKENALVNGVSNAEFLVGEAEGTVEKLYSDGVKADVVIVDPPRKGCEERLLEVIVRAEPKRIVYVSCNPGTLARDLTFLAGHGYVVREVQPVDMFPWTGHVESVTLIERRP